MTVPKRWPNHAKWARDDAAQMMQDAVEVLRQLQSHPDLRVQASTGQAIDKLQRGLRYLIQVGAEVIEQDL